MRAEQLRRARAAVSPPGTPGGPPDAVRLDHDEDGAGGPDGKFGTVGCVAVSPTHIAAATSTGA